MNQQCKVCGEPAAGFHFGAFTCEGCKSFFGRSYNNLNSISECKNNGECIINKKNRTACKACRLRKCLVVGMSKSGSRYGRRSNWFKIHCLLQEQQHQHQQQASGLQQNLKQEQRTPPPHHHQTLGLGLLGAQPFASPLLHLPKTKEELILLGLDEYKHTPSPSVSSPESHNSDSSVEINDVRRFPLFPRLLPPTFLPPPSLFLTPAYSPFYQNMLHSVNNNNGLMRNHNATPETETKVTLLDAILKSHRRTPPEEVETAMSSESSIQQDPIDLSMKTMSERGSSPAQSEKTSSDTTERDAGSEADEESDCDSERELKRIKLPTRPGPLDLTTRV